MYEKGEKIVVEGPRALKDEENKVVDKRVKVFLISEQYLDPRIRPFLFSMHGIRSTIRF